jgi:hypothetical protein
MPNYVYDDTDLDFPKFDKRSAPAGEADKHLDANAWNKTCEAVEDIKGVLRGGKFFGFERQAADPAPVGILDYMWMALDGTLKLVRGGVSTTIAASSSRYMFALWGQSNSFGQQSTANITNSQRAGIGAAFANVKFRQKSSQPVPSDPIVWTTDTSGSLSSYTSTQNNNSGHGIDATGIGPAQSLGRHLDFYQSNKCDLACVGVSGSTLNTHWRPSGTFPSGGTNLYQQALAVTDAAKASFGSQIAGFFWVQGETDATDATAAANYEANLTALFNAVRTAYGPIPIVFAQLSSSFVGPFSATVRTAQANVAAAFTNCTMVVTDDVPLGGDNIHYTADGYAALGDRLAAAMVARIGWASPVAWTIDPFSLIGIPQNATEWAAVLSAAAISSGGPSSLYLLQEAAGNLADSIGGLTMTAGGAGVTYRRALADWNVKALEFSEGGNAVFTTTSASLPNPATTSQARIMYAAMYSGGSEQNMYLWGTAGFSALARIPGGGGTQWEVADGGVKVTNATNVTDTIRPFVHVRKATATTRVDAYTDNAHVSGTFGTVTGKSNTIGCSFGTPHFTPFYCVDFFGAAAEFVTADVKTILQTLNWGNVNLGASAIPW